MEIQWNKSGLCQCGCGQVTSIARHNVAEKKWLKGKPVWYLKGHHKRKVGGKKKAEGKTVVNVLSSIPSHLGDGVMAFPDAIHSNSPPSDIPAEVKTPEQKLLLAVFIRAFEDLRSPEFRERREAWEWFHSPREIAVPYFSFICCCQGLGLSSEGVLERLESYREQCTVVPYKDQIRGDACRAYRLKMPLTDRSGLLKEPLPTMQVSPEISVQSG